MSKIKIIVLLSLMILSGKGLYGKTYTLDYRLKPGDEHSYELNLTRSKDLLLDGIADKSSSSFTCEIRLNVIEKSGNGFLVQMKVTQLVLSLFSNGTLTHTIHSKENEPNAASLRRMINQNILFTLSEVGRIDVINGLEAFIGEMRIPKAAQEDLQHTFSKVALSELLQMIFPIFPDHKVSLYAEWETELINSGYLNLEKKSHYKLEKEIPFLDISCHNLIQKQSVKVPISAISPIYVMSGSMDHFYSVAIKSGLTHEAQADGSLVSNDGNLTLSTSFDLKLLR